MLALPVYCPPVLPVSCAGRAVAAKAVLDGRAICALGAKHAMDDGCCSVRYDRKVPSGGVGLGCAWSEDGAHDEGMVRLVTDAEGDRHRGVNESSHESLSALMKLRSGHTVLQAGLAKSRVAWK